LFWYTYQLSNKIAHSFKQLFFWCGWFVLVWPILHRYYNICSKIQIYMIGILKLIWNLEKNSRYIHWLTSWTKDGSRACRTVASCLKNILNYSPLLKNDTIAWPKKFQATCKGRVLHPKDYAYVIQCGHILCLSMSCFAHLIHVHIILLCSFYFFTLIFLYSLFSSQFRRILCRLYRCIM